MTATTQQQGVKVGAVTAEVRDLVKRARSGDVDLDAFDELARAVLLLADVVDGLTAAARDDERRVRALETKRPVAACKRCKGSGRQPGLFNACGRCRGTGVER